MPIEYGWCAVVGRMAFADKVELNNQNYHSDIYDMLIDWVLPSENEIIN